MTANTLLILSINKYKEGEDTSNDFKELASNELVYNIIGW